MARGTAAERALFTPDPPTPASGPDPLHIWFETDTGDTYAWDGSGWEQVNTGGGGAATIIAWKDAVRAATVVAGTLATSFENGDTVDGVTLATGDRILVKTQASATENGIYTVNASGAPTRATDADSGTELLGATVKVLEGSTNADKEFQCTTNATITIGATNLTFEEVGFGKGTSFPSTPYTGMRFWRSDRAIEYYYDGTRWLSTNLYSMSMETQETSLNPITASNSNFRVTHPFWSIYDIYVEKYFVIMNNSATTAANYFTTRLQTRDAGASASLGVGLSGQGDTQSQAVGHSEDINTVIASSIEYILSVHTATGTPSVHIGATITYRLVG